MFKFLLILLTSCAPVYATLNDVDKQFIFPKNILDNGGFENGKAGWTASAGTFTTVTSGSNLLTGLVSATWDSGGAAQTLSFKSVTIPKGLYGRNGVAVCKIQTPSGSATHTLQAYDGSNILSSQTITSSTTPAYNFVNFIYPSSGSVVLRIVSVAADEPLIAIDDCHLGGASEINLTNISQAQFVASGYFATTASCGGWTRTNTALGAVASDTDCPGPTVEYQGTSDCVMQTTDANLPQVTFTNCGPGVYEVYMSAYMGVGAGNYQAVAISDGTTTSGQNVAFEDGNTSNNRSAKGTFVYTTASDRTFAIHVASNTSSVNIDNSQNLQRTNIVVKRFPLSSETALKPDQVANSWSGYHDQTCSWARTNTAYGDPTADATCALVESFNTNFGTVATYTVTNAMPGITFTPSKTQKYFVCAQAKVTGHAQLDSFQLYNATTTGIIAESQSSGSLDFGVSLCGITQGTAATSTTVTIRTKSASGAVTIGAGSTQRSAIEWTIFAIDSQLPAPLLVNSVTNSSSGVTRVEFAKLNCDAASTIMTQHGSWVSSIGNISSGACAVTLSAGVFSATPYCSVTPANGSGREFIDVNATSTTAVSVLCSQDGGAACTATDLILMCGGAH